MKVTPLVATIVIPMTRLTAMMELRGTSVIVNYNNMHATFSDTQHTTHSNVEVILR